MRNHYESEIGHFEGAITPDVDTFRDSLPLIEEDLQSHKKDKNIVMYCTVVFAVKKQVPTSNTRALKMCFN